MSVSEVRVEGAARLRRSLRQAGDDLSDLRASHKEAANIAADAGAARAPFVTGNLRRTIRGAGTKTAGIVRAGNNTKTPYANPQQWGWGKRRIKATFFLTKGASESEPRWIGVYSDYLEQVVERIEGA